MTDARRELWSFGEVSVAVGPSLHVPYPDDPITGVSIDTRTLQPGDLFVALKNTRDGNEFVQEAFRRGASGAIVDAGYDYERAAANGDPVGTLFVVPDTLRALEALGRAARARLSPDARVIAITGSAGKTGTTAMLHACLAPLGATHAPEKSFNNHWGVPLTLARMPAATRYGVFEIGMNHAGEIAPLTRLVRPHIAIITNVLPVHVGNFPDGEVGVANAKAEIFAGLTAGGTAIIPRDTPHFECLRRAAEAAGATTAPRTFGRIGYVVEETDAFLTIVGLDYSGPSIANHVAAEIDGRQFDYELGIAGEHIAKNSLAVLLCLDALGKLSASTLEPLLDVDPPVGRGARTQFDTPGGPILLIDESYNANPASMAAAIDVTNWSVRGPYRQGVIVLGDMLELGEESEKHHAQLAQTIQDPSNGNINQVFACGKFMRHMYDGLLPEHRGTWTPTSNELVDIVPKALRPGDVVMVKGSLGSRMAPIVEAIKKHFAPVAPGG